MEWFRWIVGGGLLVLGCIPILGNWHTIFRRYGSLMPLFGGVAATIGGAVLPIDGAWKIS